MDTLPAWSIMTKGKQTKFNTKISLSLLGK